MSTILESDRVTDESRSITALAYAVFNGTTSPSLTYAHNISSYTRVAGGAFSLSFSTAMPDANYAIAQFARRNDTGTGNMVHLTGMTSGNGSVKTASTIDLVVHNVDGGGRSDLGLACHFAVYG
jgi:hypothetical protein